MLLIVLGPPRCGTTLAYNIARLIVENLGRGYGYIGQEENFPEEAERYTGRGDPPSKVYDDLENSSFAESEEVFVFHFHDALCRFKNMRMVLWLARNGHLKVIYPTRDLRASVESHMRGFRVPYKKALGFLENHCLPTWQFLRPHMGEEWVMRIEYQDLVTRLGDCVASVAEFLGEPLDPDTRTSIVAACSPERAWNPSVPEPHRGGWPWLDRQESVSLRKVSEEYWNDTRWEEVLTPVQVGVINGLGDGWNKELGYG